MADAKGLLAGTIDDYLVSIAHGLRSAQAELDRAVTQSGEGGANVQYHVPSLDFELKITMHLV